MKHRPSPSKSGERLPALEVANYVGWTNQSALRNCGNASPISLSPGRNLITWRTLVYRISTTITLPSRLIPHTKKITANPQLHYFNEQQIFKVLDQLRPTTEGIDHLPDWFLRLLAPICARSLASLINLSLGCSYVPLQWKMAVFHPVPKIKTPVGPSDYRPISVVPILSRVVERLVVSTYLYSALTKPRW